MSVCHTSDAVYPEPIRVFMKRDVPTSITIASRRKGAGAPNLDWGKTFQRLRKDFCQQLSRKSRYQGMYMVLRYTMH